MAHLWMNDDADEWAALALEAHAYDLDCFPPAHLSPSLAQPSALTTDVDTARPPSAVLLRVATPGEATWVVLAGSPRGVSVNGLAVLTGIAALADRDELRVAGRPPMYFSTERVAELSICPTDTRPISCPRCREAIEAGSPAVRCPRCDVWHHQLPDRACWTYTEHCAACGHPTALDAGFSWTPEGH